MKIKDVNINDYERVDDLHCKGYLIIQDPKKFCFGIDAVLLSNFANVKKNEIVMDLGTGTGIIPILLEAKTEGKLFIGIEIQKESVEMAKRSVELNGISEKVKIECTDIKEAEKNYKLSSFDVITSNPPYMINGGGLINNYTPKAIARHELLCTLEDIIKCASKLLKYGGRFYMVHRPYRLADIFDCMRKYNIEPKKIRFIHPYIDKEPNMVLIESIRSAKPMLKILPPLVIYKKKGEYTEEIYKIYYNNCEEIK